MVGGGPGSYVAGFHRKAAGLDEEIELVAGAFSSKPEKSYEMGKILCLNPERVYGSYKEMAQREAGLPDGEKLDFVSIVTPNYLHFPVAKEFILKGFNILCDKPLVMDLNEATELLKLVKKHDVLFAVTYNYTGYPMAKQAKEMIRQGMLGDILKVIVEYLCNYVPVNTDIKSIKKDFWRLDPARVGSSSCLADLGSHAENLSNYVTGLKIERVFADLKSFVSGCELENDATILLQYKNGAKGSITQSQVLTGEENNLNIRVYGSKASLAWYQNNPAVLSVRFLDKPEVLFKANNDYLEPLVKNSTRLPPGHPEAFIEAFANIYRNFARTVRARKYMEEAGPFDNDFPTIEDGYSGMNFIDKVIKSFKTSSWVDI
ncbi:MAG: Gfo/Idh/MocA family oxidoreductase [Actinobacteria bacterium]|nr:Gfo/Idh/MocA family oxidoreductase [Actinomycetota bacterium]MBM3712136.1 Gfo/Idh/MocA family oxidoreductase [Actinomycetota bacterium]